MTKVRVAHVITRLCNGGAQENTFHTVRMANTERFESDLISGPTTGSEGSIEGDVSGAGVAITRVPSLTRDIAPHRDHPEMQRLFAEVDSCLTRGRELKRWWQQVFPDGFHERFELSRSQNRPDRAFGFFDSAPIGGSEMRLMGNYQHMFYDLPKPPDPRWLGGRRRSALPSGARERRGRGPTSAARWSSCCRSRSGERSASS